MAGLTGQLDYLFLAVAVCLMVTTGECFVIAGPRGPRTWEFTAVALPAEVPHGGAVMLISADVTDRRNAETRLVRAERTAALWTFTAGIGHQFNNLNMAALSSLRLAQADPDLPPRAAAGSGSRHGPRTSDRAEPARQVGGGSIDVASTRGAGTTVTVRVPCTEAGS